MQRFYNLKILIFTGFLVVMSSSIAAETATDYQQRLDSIRDKITNVLSALSQNKDQRNTVRTELRKLEVKIAISAKKLRKTQRKHKKSVKKLKTSRAELKKLKRDLAKQRKILGEQLRSAYAMGQQPQLKMLLNQQDPTEMGRAMVYYTYLNRARGKEISTFLSSIEKQKKLEASIKKTSENLASLVSSKKREKKQLGSHRVNRKNLLARLNKDIDNQQLTLNDLKSSRNRIEDLLMALGELLADIPAEAVNQKPFGQLRGKLPWPVKGKFRANFGTSRKQGDLKWNGVIIKADYDTRVRAVTHGRVAFADWLQGYGFITIIDHNDGYMSLYGYTQELYKQVGDWVEASEVIATVGDSGGQSTSGLYFEIRKQGKPVNPKKWCSRSIQHLALLEN
ncbi:MAG: peptidase M23 [endosymbiont of Galathealinum brachiosum]|uniref:Peptidase M23 n=1 Tax=endosymbiont of Galathealinum brachiosum TaxID=2200906 RepID=A0A370DEN2_9GAMM|nr:MAG: peptidase M23 [endosymbiont of Galathealinum brachiosum]